MASWVSTSMVLTLLGFCVSVLFIVFVCSRLACALVRRHRLRRNRRSRFPDLADAAAGGFLAIHVDRLGHTTAATSTGLDPAAVAAFPTRAFSAASAAAAAGGSSASSDAAPQCIVCLAEYEDNDPLRILPYCGHDFHVACIDMWLKQHSTCPVCRISLCDLPASTYAAPPPPSSVIIPPYSPEASRSDPCNCLFVSAGHSSRTSEVLRNEPDQASQIVYPPSFDGGINLPASEVNPPGENNNQTVKKHVESPQIHDKS